MNAIDNVGEAFHNAARDAAKTRHFRRGPATARPATQWEPQKHRRPTTATVNPPTTAPLQLIGRLPQRPMCRGLASNQMASPPSPVVFSFRARAQIARGCH